MIGLRFPELPRVRPAWRKWDGHRTQRCRCCQREIRAGWMAIGVQLPDPYLCGYCWADGGACTELS